MSVLGVLLIATIGLLVIGGSIHSEANEFNKGYCRKCGRKLKYEGVDNDGGRCYMCEHCGSYIWVTWSVVDQHSS